MRLLMPHNDDILSCSRCNRPFKFKDGIFIDAYEWELVLMVIVNLKISICGHCVKEESFAVLFDYIDNELKQNLKHSNNDFWFFGRKVLIQWFKT